MGPGFRRDDEFSEMKDLVFAIALPPCSPRLRGNFFIAMTALNYSAFPITGPIPMRAELLRKAAAASWPMAAS